VGEKNDPFMSQLQPAAMSSLTGELITGDTLDDQRAECRRRFRAGVREFLADEQAAIRRLVGEIHPKLVRAYPLFGRTPWSFIKLSNDLCGRMPHTRGRHIVLSEMLCRIMVGAASRKSAPARPQAIEILVHEQMHVFQRGRPGFFDTLYTQVFGFEFTPTLKLHPYLIGHVLPNPDGPDCRWILAMRSDNAMTRVLPMVLLNEGEGLRQMPLEIREVGVSLEKTADGYRPEVGSSGKPVMRSLHRIPGFVERFGDSANAYHPNEAGADFFAKLFVAELTLGEEGIDEADDQPQWQGLESADHEQICAEAHRWFKRLLADPEAFTPSARRGSRGEPRPGGRVR